MDKKKPNPLARFRGFIQAGATLLTNLHLPNFAKGTLYQGGGKYVCVPGLNCYSCPGAAGACPVGAFQAVVGSSKFRFSYYITGILILFGVLLGRFICGFLCPFGWFQDLLHKIPTKKFSTKKLSGLRYLKYLILVVMVFLLPALVVNVVGMGNPFFCKYLCPQVMIRCLRNSNVHFARPAAFAAGDTFALIHLKLQKGNAVKPCVKRTQGANPFAEGAIEHDAQDDHHQPAAIISPR